MESIQALDEIRTSNGSKHTSEIRLDMQKAMQVRRDYSFSSPVLAARLIGSTTPTYRTTLLCSVPKIHWRMVSRNSSEYEEPGRMSESRIDQ